MTRTFRKAVVLIPLLWFVPSSGWLYAEDWPPQVAGCPGVTDCNGNLEDDPCDVSCSNNGTYCVDGSPVNGPCSLFPSCGTSCDADDNDVPDECEEPTRIYVDHTVTGGDGTSWCLAYDDLQDALSGATTGDDIWVASGTYYPGSGRSATFRLKDGVDVYGGFDGTESVLGDRDLPSCTDGDAYEGKPCTANADCGASGTCNNSSNATILSGDIDEPDDSNCTPCTSYCVGGRCLKGENAYHVVTFDVHPVTTKPRLDGFVIEAGMADGLSTLQYNQGAAIHTLVAQKRCWDDEGETWGNVCSHYYECSNPEDHDECLNFYCFDKGVDVYNTMIQYNYASGHGAVNDFRATSTYDNCYFYRNEADKGAGLYIDNGRTTIDDCLFSENDAASSPNLGGGMSVQGRSMCPVTPAPAVTDCTFHSNTAAYGGGIWASDTSLTVTDSDFIDNYASMEGGGLFSIATDLTVDWCVFDTNKTEFYGGAISVVGSETTEPVVHITDTRFQENLIEGYSMLTLGAGLFAAGLNSLNVERCEFLGNWVDDIGGAGVTDLGNTASKYVNCLFQDNYSTRVSGTAYKTGAMFVYASTTELINCTIVGNAVAGTYIGQGGVYVDDGFPTGPDGDLTITNCILWENERGTINEEWTQLAKGANAELTVTYTTIENCDTGSGGFCENPSDGNKSTDPDFIEDPTDCDSNGWLDPPCGEEGNCPAGSPDDCDDYGNLRLGDSSGAIDSGDNSAISGHITDLDLLARRIEDVLAGTPHPSNACPNVDHGAYEYSTADGCCEDGHCTGGESCCDDGDCYECCDTDDCTGDDFCCDNVCTDAYECCSDGDCTGGDVCCDNSCEECCDDEDCGLGVDCNPNTNDCCDSPALCFCAGQCRVCFRCP